MLKVWKKLNIILTVGAGLMLFIIMMIIVAEVCSRMLFNSPITGVMDIVTVLLPILIFIPMAYTEMLDGHIRVEILTSQFNQRWKIIVELLTSLCGVILFLIIAWQGWEFAASSFRSGEFYPGILRIRVYPAKIAIAVGCSLFAIQLFIKGLKNIGYFTRKSAAGKEINKERKANRMSKPS